jgi:FKBP-type peptidyl-prolyl cis-trans isomerase
MKGIIITILVLAGIAAGLWKLSADRRAEVLAQNEALRIEREEKVRAERLELFGEAGLNPAITWTDTGLGYIIRDEGRGVQPTPGAEVKFNYTVKLKDGTLVQQTEEPIESRIGQMIPGVSAGLQKIRAGGSILLFIPPRLGYGRQTYGSIPPNSGLLFEVELLDS